MTAVTLGPHERRWLVVPSGVVGSSTSAGVTESQARLFTYADVTPLLHGIAPVPAATGVAGEIAALRDEISRRAHLGRADLARALDVDRRSLSGWASGQIRPARGRVEALRLLARTVREIDAEMPGRARDVLLARRVGGDLLDLLAQGRHDLVAQWRRLPVARPAPATSGPRRRPMYAAALDAVREQQPRRVTRRGTVRDDSVYEVDPAEAAMFRDTEDDRSRRTRRR